jgi:hypothetical protein
MAKSANLLDGKQNADGIDPVYLEPAHGVARFATAFSMVGYFDQLNYVADGHECPGGCYDG